MLSGPALISLRCQQRAYVLQLPAEQGVLLSCETLSGAGGVKVARGSVWSSVGVVGRHTKDRPMSLETGPLQ